MRSHDFLLSVVYVRLLSTKQDLYIFNSYEFHDYLSFVSFSDGQTYLIITLALMVTGIHSALNS